MAPRAANSAGAQDGHSADTRDGAPAYGHAKSFMAVCGVAASAVCLASAAFAKLPPVYARCANVEANWSVAIAACSAIQSGRDSGRNLAITLTNRGIGWTKEKQLDRALVDLDRGVRLDPGYARAFNARGITDVKKGNFTQAIEDLSQALRLKPQVASVYNNRGLVFAFRRLSA